MKNILSMALATAVLMGAFSMSLADEQADKKPAPVIIHATAHTAHFNDFQVRMSKDRSLAAEVKRKGLDVAFTEWMARDHPYVFATECVKHANEVVARDFKSSSHMHDFDTLLAKRADLRMSVERLGHDIAFADWLRTERPDVYRQHFSIKPVKKTDKVKPASKP